MTKKIKNKDTIQNHLPRIVIVGAGFGGLWAAKELANTATEVILVDRNNYHIFQPLLYQVAAAELEPEEIAYPIRSIIWKIPNIKFVMADVRGIDLKAKVLKTSNVDIPFDYLILAVGSAPQFFGVTGAEEHGFTLKAMEDGVALRNHILTCFEQATLQSDEAQRQRLLTFTIVGGGPTGIEFAGALVELIYGPFMKDYPNLNFKQVKVILLEAGDRLFSGWQERLQRYAQSRLIKMGVEVRLNSMVNEIKSDEVRLKNGIVIPTRTVVWTAGVQGDLAAKDWGLPTARNGRVAVLPTLQVAGHPNLHVIGDLAYLEQGGKPLPMVAPVATQQGKVAARNILKQIKGQNLLPFHYRDMGMMVTIGRNSAVTQLFKRSFKGFVAWIIWLTVHIILLIGFRNRILVLINWAWDYFFFERAVRLILPLKKGDS